MQNELTGQSVKIQRAFDDFLVPPVVDFADRCVIAARSYGDTVDT